MRICILVLLALLGAASANTGTLLMSCPEGWILFHSSYEASCLKIMPEPKLFDEAFKSCQDIKSRLLSFSHRMDKVYFINKMIIDHIAKDPKATSLWFYDHTFGSPNMELPKPEEWMVINPNTEFSKVALQPNSTAVPRNFICEAPARPAAQRPQFQMEPEHLFISDLLVKPTAETPKDHKPFIVTFNCLAYGVPKPTIEWHTVAKAENQSLISQLINAKVITDPKEIRNPSMTEATNFILQRDCSAPNKCPTNVIQERSQLVVVNPQFLDLAKKSIACVAKNDFGSVLSHEAKIIVTKMGEYASKEDKVTVKSGISAIIHNAIKTEPDSAAADCFRVLNPADPTKDVPIEELNRVLHGAIQMSKATGDLIIDSARLEDAGEYKCRARLHNGRIGHVAREKTISLKVEPCDKTDGCDLEAKAVEVGKGYPAVLSMNSMDNHVIRSGDDFLLECPCTGKRRPDEQLTVNWNLRNSTDMPAMAIPILPQGSALLITRAGRTTHSGTYYCQCVRGKEKSDWRSVEVNVLPSTEPIDHKEVLTAKAGSKVSILCHVPADVPGLGVGVEALRGTESLADYLAKTGDSRLQLSQDTQSKLTVTISDAKESDAGIYGCRVTINFFGKWVEHDTYYTTLVVEK